MKLRLIDAEKAKLFSFSTTCETTEAAEQELIARGWRQTDAQAHMDCAVRAGAYAREEMKSEIEKEKLERGAGGYKKFQQRN